MTIFLVFYFIGPRSYLPNKLGISPIVRIVLISSTNDYYEIWLSENMKVHGVYFSTKVILAYLIFYLKSFNLNDFDTEIVTKLYFAIKVANLVNECLPEPPSPTNIPCPLLNLITLLILHTYDIAY